MNGNLVDYGANELNQYTSVDGVAFQYDADGNLVWDGVRQYTYDELGRLIRVSDGTDIQQFEYNALGARSATIINGVRTEYLVLPDAFGEILAEYDGSGTLLARNVLGNALLGRTSGAGEVRYLDFDVTGSTVGVSGAGGDYVNRYAYDPFGQALLSSESVANPYQFNGMLGARRGTGGLTQMGLRDYSASLGRFTTIDPLRFDGDLNTYRFAGNSPTMKADPTGLLWFLGTGIGLQLEMHTFGGAAFGTGVDSWIGTATAARTGDWPSTWEAIGSVGTSFALGAAFSLNGLNGFANGVTVFLDERVYPHHVDAMCGLAFQREFGTINRGAAMQMAAIEKELGGRGAGGSSVNAACLDGFPGAEDADLGIGDRCGYGEAPLVHRSIDPNDKIPPLGFGPQNFVPADASVAYTVRFENLGPGSVDANGDPYPIVATAPAQRVSIADRLSADLDWGTVRFTEFSFGETTIPVIDGLGGFHAAIPAEADGVPFIVRIDADIDVASGILSVIFHAEDPTTGLPPDAFTGVLPPEDGSGNGMGHFRFSVMPRPNLADGTGIRNVALIRFDSNEIIATNQVNPLDASQGTDPAKEALVTVDAGSPASRVEPLPQVSSTKDFTVSWSGQDAPGGAGVAGYEVYVSVDDGPYTLWLAETAATSATYHGDYGHTYAFQSIARDNVGHREEPPLVPDAQTTALFGAWLGSAGADRYGIRLAQGGGQVEFFEAPPMPGPPTFGYPIGAVGRVTFASLGGDDVFTVDATNGNPISAGGLSIDVTQASNVSVRLVGTHASEDLAVTDAEALLGGRSITLNGAGFQLDGAAILLNQLTIDGRGKVGLVGGSGSVLLLNSLSILGGGTLDLADNALVVQAADEATARDVLDSLVISIRSARNDGRWDGTGLGSSTARANRFTGLAAVQDGSQVRVKYTWEGDANLDGVVDGDDYLQIDRGFLGSGSGYGSGDFNYDRRIDGDDYFVIDNSFLGQSPTSGPGAPAGLPQAGPADADGRDLVAAAASAGSAGDPAPFRPAGRLAFATFARVPAGVTFEAAGEADDLVDGLAEQVDVLGRAAEGGAA